MVTRSISIIIAIEYDARKCYSFHRQWSFLGSVVTFPKQKGWINVNIIAMTCMCVDVFDDTGDM